GSDLRFGQRAWKPRDVLGARRNRNARSLEILAEWLNPAAQMFPQECFRDGVKRQAVFWPLETMPLLPIKHRCDRNLAFGHGFYNLIALALLHARIVGALTDQQRAADPVDMCQRRALLEQLAALGRAVIADALRERLDRRLPIGWDRFEQCHEV